MVETIIKTVVAGYLSSIVPDNDFDSPKSAEKAAKRRSSVSNKRDSIVVRRRSGEYSPSAQRDQISASLDNAQPRALTYFDCEDDVPMENDDDEIDLEDLTKDFRECLSLNQDSCQIAIPSETVSDIHDSTHTLDNYGHEASSVADNESLPSQQEEQSEHFALTEVTESDPVDASVASDDATIGAEGVEGEVEAAQDELNASMETSLDENDATIGADEMCIDVVTTEASAESSQAEIRETEEKTEVDRTNHDEDHDEAEDEEISEGGVSIHGGISKRELEAMLGKHKQRFLAVFLMTEKKNQ